MSHLPITPEEPFATLVEEFLDKPEVTLPSDGEGVRRVGTEISAEHLCHARQGQTRGQTSPRLGRMRSSPLESGNPLIPGLVAAACDRGWWARGKHELD